MSLLLLAIGVAFAWWWIARASVTATPIVALATRISFPGGLRIGDPAGAVAQLSDPDEIVIPHAHATLVIDYPLTVPAQISVASSIPHGFTRAELVRTICEQYAEVYETEDATATVGALALEAKTGLGGRNRTDGMYGIWGHPLDALVLSAMRWTRKSDGSVTIELHVHP
ncbi:MAG TPA: hypothetical protein VGM88_13620 [Kofleriaceae bacterium]|jgi:hypothetical protein